MFLFLILVICLGVFNCCKVLRVVLIMLVFEWELYVFV